VCRIRLSAGDIWFREGNSFVEVIVVGNGCDG
jgi:hypothetical protein